MPRVSNNSLLIPKQTTFSSGNASHVNLSGKTDGLIYIKDVDALERNISTQQFYNTLTTAFPATAQTNTTRVNIPGWTFDVVRDKIYNIQVHATYTTAAPGTGGSMGLITSGTGNISGIFEAALTQTASATNLQAPVYAINAVNTTAGSFMTSTSLTAGNVGYFTINVKKITFHNLE